MAHLPGSELTGQAMAGYTRYLGQLGLAPKRLGADVGSMATGIYAAQAALAALYHRNNGGGGQRVTLSLLNALFSMKSIHIAAQSDPDAYLGPRIGGPYEPIERGWATKDRPIFFAFGGSVGSTGRAGWEQFVEELGMTEMLSDERFDKRGKNTTGHGSLAIKLRPEYERHFKSWPSKDLVAKMHKYRANASVYATTAEALDHAQTKALDIVTEAPDGDARVKVRAFPGKFSDLPIEPRGNAPTLGADLAGVLGEAGIDAAELGRLEAAGAFSRAAHG
jgi:crotonobetainyl-CoA:carnitine CoA-transferase CaiB-like acyl-CoA transferase